MIVCKPLGPKLLGFQSKEMEASEPKGSVLEAKGLESTWIVTGLCPHSKADNSGVKCPCLQCDRSKKQQTYHRTVEYVHSEGNYSKETVTSHGDWGLWGRYNWEGSRYILEKHQCRPTGCSAHGCVLSSYR